MLKTVRSFHRALVTDKFMMFIRQSFEVDFDNLGRVMQQCQGAPGRKAKIPKSEADMTVEEIRAQEAKRLWGNK